MSTDAAVAGYPEWSLGDRLRKARRQSGLTQAQMADRLGEKDSTYAAWELDLSGPRGADKLLKVAKRVQMATGVAAGFILGLDEPGPRSGPDGGGLPHLDSNQKPFD